MSKTTKRYGNMRYSMRLSMDANPEPTDRLKEQWAYLDAVAKKVFGKVYDALSNAQKLELYFNINCGLYKEA